MTDAISIVAIHVFKKSFISDMTMTPLATLLGVPSNVRRSLDCQIEQLHRSAEYFSTIVHIWCICAQLDNPFWYGIQFEQAS